MAARTFENDWAVLRWKGPDATNDVDANDPDYLGDMENPNSGRYIVAGTATDGDYGITCTPDDNGETASSVTFTRGAAESNTAIATAIFNLINADVATDLALDADNPTGIARYVRLATNPSAGVVHIVYKEQHGAGNDFTAVPFAESPGTFLDLETANNTSGNRFPATRFIPFDRKLSLSQARDIEITVLAIDSSGDMLADDNTCVYSLQVLEAFERTGEIAGTDAVVTRGEQAGASLGQIVTVQCNGAKIIGCRMHTISNIPTGTDRFEIRYRAVVV